MAAILMSKLLEIGCMNFFKINIIFQILRLTISNYWKTTALYSEQNFQDNI